MKKLHLRKPDRRSLRLALSYLGISMVLSISFSVIFYRSSTGALDITVQQGGSTGPVQAAPRGSDDPMTLSIGANKGQPSVSASSSNATSLTVKFEAQIEALRRQLAQRLVLLNCGALVVGGLLSYVLARRTLRPIEAAMETQSRFAADASHELRTPLTVMQSEIEVTLRKPSLTLPRAKAALESTHQEVLRLRQLSEDLLRLAHDDNSQAAFTTVALDEVVNKAMNRMLKPARARHMSLADTMPSITVHGNQQALIQGLVILLDNAIKYSPAKSTIHIDGQSDGVWAYLRVRDEGPGIPPSDLPHIFERFYRADRSRTGQRVAGNGLGLSIAQKIIKQHGGTITVASTLGKDTTFVIKLPIQP